MRPFVVLGVALLSAASVALAQEPASAMRDIQRSHIDGNVPVARDFDSFLRRDVAAYFRGKLNIDTPEVAIELLRKGPTQSGVSLPKYYAWVVVKNDGNTVAEGALRLAAMDQDSFEVTHFFSTGDIKSMPDVVSSVFPAPLASVILERASAAMPPGTSQERTSGK